MTRKSVCDILMSSCHITQWVCDQMKMEHKAYNYSLVSVFCRKH